MADNTKVFVPGRVALVTGAASGIGLGVAKTCARRGMKVVLTDYNEKALPGAEAEGPAAGMVANGSPPVRASSSGGPGAASCPAPGGNRPRRATPSFLLASRFLLLTGLLFLLPNLRV